MKQGDSWKSWTCIVRWAAGAAWCLGIGASATAAPPVSDFFKPDAFSQVRIAPSGKLLATTMPASNGRLALAIVDIADPGKTRVIVGYSNADVWGAEWVNDERLVYRLYDEQQPLGLQRGVGLFAIDAAGKEPPREIVQLSYRPSDITGTNIVSRALTPNHELFSVLRDGSADVLIERSTYDSVGEPTNTALLRVDTRTGSARSVTAGAPEHVYGWAVDRNGEPRAAWARFQDKVTLYWKPSDRTTWARLDEGEAYGRGVPTPLYVESDRRIYARARMAPEGDVGSLVVVDPGADGADPKVEPLLTTPGFDFRGGLVLDRAGKVLGIRYLTEARGTHWFDPRLKKIQEQVDKMLPSTNNLLSCGDCENIENVLVASSSDRLPYGYRVFRVAKGTLEPIGSSRPWIKPAEMAATDFVRITTRDGLSMPVYVTRPNAQKTPAATVVLVHGGPWVRGAEWAWRGEAQFLASRGYVVVEPEFRGSTGYGNRWYRAGWKQWGLAMQDDIADAALWAIKQGYADKGRVAIAGASYGGYATLMGLIRNPEIFRCGVEWVGVTDIELMYSISWSDSSDQYQRFGMPVLIGDRVKDAAKLAATSPIKLAAKIDQPLLMAYGGLDRRVPIDHGTQMRDAVQKTNKAIEWKVYNNEGHGWVLPANNDDFWTRVESFLDRNLKSAP